MENLTADQVYSLKKEGKKLLIDYWAKWCVPCRTLIPKLEEIAKEYPDIEFVKIDVDENTEHSVSMGIRSVPTVMIYNGQILIDRSSGVKEDNYYKTILDSL